MYVIKADGQVLHSPALSDAGYQVISPRLKREFNKADSLTFILPPTNVMRDAIHKMKTVITVEWDGQEIFRGRVLEDRTDTFNQTEVVCEGELAYLLDSLVRLYKFDGNAVEYLQMMLDQHNAQVEEEKQFALGIVTAVTEEDTFNTEGVDYKDTLTEIHSVLLDAYKGYLRVRYENGVRYLDYLKDYNEVNSQQIEFGVNLLNIENHINAQQFFTVLVPLSEIEGKNKKLTIAKVNNGLDYIENEEAIAKYGRIVKTFVWPDIEDEEQLLELGREKLKNAGTLDTLTIKAIDLHLLDADTDMIDLGDTVRIYSDPHGIDRQLVCSAMNVDLESPENTQYIFGELEETIAGTVAANKQRSDSQINHIKQLKYVVQLYVEYLDEVTQELSSVSVSLDAVNAELDMRVKRGEVIAAINLTPEAATINAGRINLEGYVSASKLSAEVANLHETYASQFTTYRLTADYATFGYLSMRGSNFSPKTISYTDADGNAATMEVLAK